MTISSDNKNAILDLWAKGKSGAQIRDELGLRSRNVVIGIVSRARKAKDPRAQTTRTSTATIKPARAPGVTDHRLVERAVRKRAESEASPSKLWSPAVAPIQDPEEPMQRRAEIAAASAKLDRETTTSTAVRFLDARPRQCRFPLWSGRIDIETGEICGAPQCRETTAYCAAHHALVYVAPKGSITNREITRAVLRVA